ncbi:MAG: SH3 domain-containing protein [bacterium]|nr:SH3 domain-containing protein [bacterium]
MGMANNGIREFFAKYYRYFIVGGLFVVLVVLLIVFALNGKKKTSQADSEAADAATESSVEVPTDKYEVDAYPAVNTLLENYCSAMAAGDADTMASLSNTMTEEERFRIQETAKHYDGFQNYKVYTKIGPEPNSYLAIVGYDIKFKDIDTLAPALTSVYVCTNEAGALYINKEAADGQTEEYFKALAVQDDVVELLKEVQTKYDDAVASDPALATLVAGLPDEINTAVKNALNAQAEAAQPVEETPVEEVPSVITVKTVDKVNIRKSASTESDALGKAEIGDTFTQLEALENGWSKIDYNGTEAYIKTEFLEVVEAAGGEAGDAAAGDAGTDAESTDEAGATDSGSATTATTSGKITVKDTVNIRESASETGNKLGVAYRGEQFDLIEKSNGWCKIDYKGSTAYVKADFVE